MSLKDQYLVYMQNRDGGIAHRGEEMIKKVRPTLLRWCQAVGAVVIGGTSIDLLFRLRYKTFYYPEGQLGDLDLKLDKGRLSHSMEKLDEMLLEGGFGKSEAVMSGSTLRVKLRGVIVAEAGLTSSELFNEIPIERIDVDYEGTKVSLSIVQLSSFIEVYFALLSFRRLLNAADKVHKVL